MPEWEKVLIFYLTKKRQITVYSVMVGEKPMMAKGIGQSKIVGEKIGEKMEDLSN